MTTPDLLRARPDRRLLHISRAGLDAPHDAHHDWLVGVEPRSGGWILLLAGDSRATPGSIDDDQLIQLVFAADVAVVW